MSKTGASTPPRNPAQPGPLAQLAAAMDAMEIPPEGRVFLVPPSPEMLAALRSMPQIKHEIVDDDQPGPASNRIV